MRSTPFTKDEQGQIMRVMGGAPAFPLVDPPVPFPGTVDDLCEMLNLYFLKLAELFEAHRKTASEFEKLQRDVAAMRRVLGVVREWNAEES